jgi:hypothetical protein
MPRLPAVFLADVLAARSVKAQTRAESAPSSPLRTRSGQFSGSPPSSFVETNGRAELLQARELEEIERGHGEPSMRIVPDSPHGFVILKHETAQLECSRNGARVELADCPRR